MDTGFGTVKIKYWKGAFELTYEVENTELFVSSKFWTPHYRKPNTVTCMRNNKSIAYFRKFAYWYEQYVDGFDKIQEYLEPFYPTLREQRIPRVDLQGVTLRDYQETAVDLMLTYSKFCLFYGTGVGKTYMALTYLHSVAAVRQVHAVIITKAKIVPQYVGVALEKLVDFTVFDNIDEYTREIGGNTLLVTNYERMKQFKHDTITDFILDESHMCKSFTSGFNAQACRLGSLSDNIYLFTGTPMEGYNYEKFAQFKIMYPSLVPGKTAFMFRYYNLDDYGKPRRYDATKHEDELEEVIDSITFGGHTEDLLDLPPMNEYRIPCRFQDKTLYNEFKKNWIYRHSHGTIIAKMQGQHRIKLRQLCNGFATTDQKKLIHLENPKELPFKQLVSTMDTGLVFTQFDIDIDNVTRYLDDISRTYGVVNGSMSPKKAQRNIDAFKLGELDFLVIQLKSGSAGLDLQNTNNVLFYAVPDGNFIEFNQAKYRIRRIGQTRECNYYYFITKGTIEPELLRNLGVKNMKHNNQFRY